MKYLWCEATICTPVAVEALSCPDPDRERDFFDIWGEDMVLQAYCERLWLRVGERLEFWEDKERPCSGTENNSHKFPTECTDAITSLFGETLKPIPILWYALFLPHFTYYGSNPMCRSGSV